MEHELRPISSSGDRSFSTWQACPSPRPELPSSSRCWVNAGSGSWESRASRPISSGRPCHRFSRGDVRRRAATRVRPRLQCAQGEPTAAAARRAEPTALLLESPIRSGQSVIFPYGDVTVLGSVSSGAEVVAGGSIHVYGALRGRAMAGSMGNARARIFCSRNEAELISIDGYYRTAEEMDANLRSRPAQCWLEDRVLMIAALD